MKSRILFFLGVLGLPGLTAQTPSLPPLPNAKPPILASPSVPVSPLPVEPDYLRQYGNILQAGNSPAYPVKLNFPYPNVGEFNLPTPDDVEKRMKLERLAALSDKEILDELGKWPPFQKMSLGDQGRMLTRIQDFRDRRQKIAADEAKNLGLTLTPPQQAVFEKRYWALRLQADQDLIKQFTPILQDRETKMKQTIFKEFSTTKPIAAAGK